MSPLANDPHDHAVHFEITHQEHTMEPDANGTLVPVYHVHFRTPSGTDSHVTIPQSHYTAENVAQAVHDETAEIERVHALTHNINHPSAG